MSDRGQQLSQLADAAGMPDPLERLTSSQMLVALAREMGMSADVLVAQRAIRECTGGAETASIEAWADHVAVAAERMGLRSRAAVVPLSEALSWVSGKTPLAVGTFNSGTASWVLIRRIARGTLELVRRDGEIARCDSGDLARQLGCPADGTVSTLVLSTEATYGSELHAPAAGNHHGEPGHAADGHGHGISPLRRLTLVLRPELGDIGVVSIFSALVSLLTLATPLAVESLVNTVAFGRMLQPLFILCLLLFTFLVFAATLRVLQAYVAEIIQRRIFVRVVADLAYRMPRARHAELVSQNGPELMNRFFDVMTVQKSAAMLTLDGVAIVLQLVIGMVVLAFYHPYLLTFNLTLLALLAVIILVLGRGAIPTAIDESKAKYAVAAWLEELAGFSVTFKSAGGARRAVDYADRLASEYVRARGRHFRVVLRQIVSAVGLQAVGSTALLGLGGWLVMQGTLTLGQLVAAELIVAVILGSVAKLGKQMESFYDLLAAVDKLGHLFDLPIERLTGGVFPDHGGAISLRVRNACYAFEGGIERLNGVSFDVAAGELVAITGGLGSGKSTMIDVLFALRELTAGRIEFNGIDARALHPGDMRRHMALVRDKEVFSGTVAENVHLDRPDIDLVRVSAALRDADLLEEIFELADGLDTELQPGGAPLSDSQARRLMLARAWVGQPRLLLIDGLLDSLPEAVAGRILKTLAEARKATTIVLASAREDLIALCDRRIVLNAAADSGAAEPRGEAERLTAQGDS